MTRKIVAVINDQTGVTCAVLEGYQSFLPFSGIPSKYIRFTGYSYGDSHEYSKIVFDYFGFEQEVSTEKYSLVYEEISEDELETD